LTENVFNSFFRRFRSFFLPFQFYGWNVIGAPASSFKFYAPYALLRGAVKAKKYGLTQPG
jgi:hypothetical protein